MEVKQKAQMEKLGFTPEEIAEIETADKAIDRGEKLFDLPPELEAGAKKARQADRKKTAPAKREKKIDLTKRSIIQTLIDVLSVNNGCAHLADTGSVEVINCEREFLFTISGRKFKITLSCPRS